MEKLPRGEGNNTTYPTHNMISSSSPDKSALSPLSSRFAAEAERENIHRLKEECRGLSTALKVLQRNSKEWVMVKSNLDIAREELACVLEDRNLFRSFACGNTADLNVEECSSLIPTPPLGRKEEVESNARFSSPVTKMPSLVTKTNATSMSENPNGDSGRAKFNAAISDTPLVKADPNLSAESNEWGTTLNQNENNWVCGGAEDQTDLLDKVPKYSLEWFQIKMETGAAFKRCGNSTNTPNPSYARHVSLVSTMIESPPAFHGSLSPTDQRKITSLPDVSKAKSRCSGISASARCLSPTFGDFLQEKQNNGCDEKLDVKDQLAKLKTVQKYSLEWFLIKKEITAATKIVCGAGDDVEQSMSSSQDKKMQRCQCRHTEKSRSFSKKMMINNKKYAERKVDHITEKLKRVPKYSLEWFQMKQEVEALKIDITLGN
eukprot:CAMPEP_0172527886 /NCGR_PEP_ID=MMETSP1067-20121228/2432_1 /TAXON_ID=265564 ORGANISM="Thalassiosira punctigera, Strain Tpunct2005C2" /NCGR_SAMPLE_ID=MMETSP1067 /ASSEMBLY_ACC=CAM_ASM_000444 /LENGTH=433 /DNA_ID=CAMNT_0013311707 /DNA_START=245 /DNA_END=1546 /DNA_ORIENTATION=+